MPCRTTPDDLRRRRLNVVGRDLEAKARSLTRLTPPSRMPRWDARHGGLRHRELPQELRDREELPNVEGQTSGRPIYHHKRESIVAHPTIFLAALAVGRWIAAQTR